MSSSSKAQSQEVSYELHTLGWKAFQDLCATILSEVLGQTFEEFLPSHDGGRDGAFHGQWSNLGEGGEKGSYAVQCKYSSNPNKSLSVAALDDEFDKARKLAKRRLADNYILMTNMGISGTSAEEIRAAFLNIPGIKWFAAFGSTWISSRIRDNARLRMLVPRIYGLGDLSQILDERACAQARAILDSFGDDLAKFVITDAYRRSARAIQEHGFVLLLGEPACGKSTIAAALALGALDRWNCQTFKVLSTQAFVDHWNTNEPKQFFWIDDVFGPAQYEKEDVLAWNRAFSHLNSAIKKGARVLFTSRDYIFEAALHDLKTSAFPLIKNSQVVVNVEKLKTEEREQILYNHIKLGDQPQPFKIAIKPYLTEVASSARFLPEIARRLGSAIFTRHLHVNSSGVSEFVENPIDFLLEVIESLDPDTKASLALVFMRGGKLESPIELADAERLALERLGSTLAGVRLALDAIKGSLVKFVSGSEQYWQFKHPTISEAIGEIIGRDAELVDVYLSGTPASKIVREITCGQTDIRGVKVIVPSSRNSAVSRKLCSLESSRQHATFLAYRCDALFLEEHLRNHPDVLERAMNFGSYLSAVPEVALIVRLFELGLLPEQKRLQFVDKVKELAVITPDADFLTNNRIRAILASDEIKDILSVIKQELLSDVSSEIDNRRMNYDSFDDFESHFEPLRTALQAFAEEFDAQDDVQASIENGLDEIDNTIEEMRWEQEEEEEQREQEMYETSSSSSTPAPKDQDRTIFDDIDV